MTPAARIYVLVRDDHDRETWETVHALEGHWNPWAAIRHYLENEDPGAGTYKCVSGTATATTGWDGQRIT